ncbi:MAG: ATP synthase F1 subunit delta [Candidatus Margulisbacteria bacterium]|jgi:F-type H+-transporting ATPase subunit delta|nr:ATP synthase F1 subunit delta [Candidatus Margulisiibacteriota bacterium]
MLNYSYNLQELILALETAGELDLFIGDVFRFNLACDENYGIKEILFDEHIAPDSKRDYFRKTFETVLSAGFQRFILQLIENNDLHFYEQISAKFVRLIGQERNASFVEALSAVELSAAQQETLRSEMERLLKSKVYLHNNVSKRILGGLIIKSGGKMLDFSLQAGLDKLKTVLAP